MFLVIVFSKLKNKINTGLIFIISKQVLYLGTEKLQPNQNQTKNQMDIQIFKIQSIYF